MAFKFLNFFNERGEYKPDPDPVVLAPEFDRPPTLQEQIARLVRDPAFARQITGRDEDFESFEEADDFDIPDDPVDPMSPWEQDFDLAAVHGMQHNVIRPFTEEERLRAGAAVEELKASQRKRSKKATPLPDEEGGGPVDPKISKGTAPSDSDNS